jgi:hypothetical protein
MPTELLTPLRGIPHRDSDFTLTAGEAQRDFGCGEDLLGALREAGLTRRGDDGDERYAFCDLHYLGLRAGTASSHLWAMRLWRQSLERVRACARLHAHVTFVPQLEEGQETLPGRVIASDDGPRDVLLRTRQPAGELDVTLRGDWPSVPEPLAPVLDEVARLELCHLPDHARGDVERVRRLGVVDCWTAAEMIIHGCRAAGFPARLAEGLIVMVPFSSAHNWAEVLIDDVWTPVDPLMIGTLRRFADLDPLAWPVDRSLGPLFARILVTSTPLPLVSHDGAWVRTTFLTRIEDAPRHSDVAAGMGDD